MWDLINQKRKKKKKKKKKKKIYICYNICIVQCRLKNLRSINIDDIMIVFFLFVFSHDQIVIHIIIIQVIFCDINPRCF